MTKNKHAYDRRYGTKVKRHMTLCGEVGDVMSALGRLNDAISDHMVNPTSANLDIIRELSKEVLAETLDCTEQAMLTHTLMSGQQKLNA